MTELFKKRKQNFQKHHRKYLPYVFNDHFVLVLVFLLGYILYQYSQLLQHFPKKTWPIMICLFLLTVFLLQTGAVATYIEEADQQFLLAKEDKLIDHIKTAGRQSFITGVLFQSLCLTILFPIYARLGLSLVLFFLMLLGLAIIKWFIQAKKVAALMTEDRLNWTVSINSENRRKQKILKFYSLFVSVKGITSGVKKRTYLNPILQLVSKKSGSHWLNLYARAFLRSSDYLGLFFRLTVLALLSLIFISNTYLSLMLASIFNYLLLFQLLSLYHHFDYHYLTHLYPGENSQKKKDLLILLRAISAVLLAIEIGFSGTLVNALEMVAFFLVMTVIYLPYKLKNIID
ncbi:ABC transporter permease [Streptococcus hongkongensis]|nr:multidrug ABC transporter permease [Streptococcus uberis]